MDKTLLLIFSPDAAWESIRRSRRTVFFILLVYFLPLLLLTSAGEAYGLNQWGEWQSRVARLRRFSLGETVVFEVCQFLLSLLIVFIGAGLLQSISAAFQARHTYLEAFTVVAYCLGPMFIFRLFNALAFMPPWVTWCIGITFSMGVLYHGLPRIMRPEPAHVFGLFLISGLVLLIITGLAQFVVTWFLQGRSTGLDSAVSQLAARLPL